MIEVMCPSIQIHIDDDILKSYPNFEVIAFRMDVYGPNEVIFSSENEDVITQLTEDGLTVQGIADQPLIRRWREVFRECGMKPSTFKSSPEALARRYLKDPTFRVGLPLVDMYCAASARHLAPLGGYDTDRLAKLFGERVSIALRRSVHGDTFNPLGGRESDFPIGCGAPVYAVEDSVLCWGLNVRDSASTCLVPGTRSALFVGEATDHAQASALRRAIQDLRESLQLPRVLLGPVAELDASTRTLEVECLGP